MPDREKVMNGLKCHANAVHACVADDIENCPYYDYAGCSVRLAQDALALLKEQEPRVLDYSEIEKHPLVWLEDNGKEDVIPALFLQYNGWNVEFALQAPDEWVDMIVRCATAVTFKEMYGTTWRAWTSRPSPEQMRDTPWEEDSDEKPV